MKRTLAWALLLSAATLSAEAAGQAGQAGAFLSQPVSARGAAMGGAMAALTDDTSSLSWNPAGLSRLAKPEVMASDVILFEDTSFEFAAGGFATARWGSFAADYLLQSSGGFEQRNTPNDTPTTFSVSQSALTGGWGRGFALPVALRPSWITEPKPLSFGVSVKQVRESIGSVSASGNGLDAGFIFKPQSKIMVGVMVQNLIAPQLTFVSAPVDYPKTIEVTPAYLWTFSKDWDALMTFQLSKTDGQSLTPSGGVELQYLKYAALRVGMQDTGLTTGVGARLGNSSFDYAVLVNDLGLSHLFSFTQRFGQTREELEYSIRRGIQKLTYAEGARLSKIYIVRAEEELRTDKVSEALKDLEAASLLDPENAAIRSKIDKVKTRWDESLKQQTIERTVALAREQGDQGNMLGSRQYWRSVLELQPENAEAQKELARIDQALSVEERTRMEGLRQAQAAGEIAMALAQASTFLSGGKLRQAKIEAEKTLERFPGNDQIQIFIDQIRMQTEALVTAKLAEADKLAEAGNLTEALRSLDAALREDPGNPKLTEKAAALRAQVQKAVTPEQRKEFERLYYQAVEQYLRGDYKSADSVADELLKIDPASDSAKALKEKAQAALRYAQ